MSSPTEKVRRTGGVESRFTDDDIRAILDARERGEALRSIGQRFDISGETVRLICRRELNGSLAPERGPAKLPEGKRYGARLFPLGENFIENLARDMADRAARPARTGYDSSTWESLGEFYRDSWRDYAREIAGLVVDRALKDN